MFAPPAPSTIGSSAQNSGIDLGNGQMQTFSFTWNNGDTFNIEGRKFKIKDYYNGIAKFDFNDLCNKNIGAEDYLKLAEISKLIIKKYYLTYHIVGWKIIKSGGV